MRIGCVVMAAGDARRFGENKLAALFDGKPLILRALEAVPAEEFSAVAVVTQYPEVEALASEFGFIPVHNPHPDWGISHTIRLGLEALGECDAALFQVSDQPMLRRETVKAEVEFFRRHPDKLVGLGHDGVRGNPCIFPAAWFPELLALKEDHGGSSVIRRHEEDLLLFECPAQELADADTRQALRAMEERKRLI
ncbi:MAG: nucleotidyltransferase family protein [Oscillospiraceae bacterium]|nr:nucleotidyltransferase family protein [Oscillospiraceae bacterium]